MKSLPLTWSALLINALIVLPASATTMTDLSSFEGEEEPTVIYYPATNTFKNDSSFINITNVSPGVVQMLLRYNSTWWDGDGAVSTRTDRQRAEVKGLGPHQKVGDLFEYVTTWRTSPNFPASPHWEDFFQLKATDGDDSLPLVFGDVREGPANAHVMWLPAGASSHIVARNIPSADATWQALTWRIKTSPRGSSTGLVQASVNGDSFQGPTNVDVSLASSTDYRPKWGLYRGMSTGLALGTDNGADYIQHSNVCVNKITSTTTAAPDFNPGGGIYAGAQTAVITSATPGAVIYYTTDGSTPSATHGTVYTGPVTVNATTTIQAIASASGMTDSSVNFVTYVINGSSVAAPTFNPAPGTYTGAQGVTISTSTSGAAIRYTTDGSTPSETAGTLYSGTPVSISSTTTLSAIAYESGLIDSPVSSGTYTITLPRASAPVFSPGSGAYNNDQLISVTSSDSGVSINYTTDGSTPSETHGMPIPPGGITVNATQTLQAIAFGPGFSDSPVTIAPYTMIVSPVSFSPGGGTYTSAQTVTLSTATNGATIRYTLDGSTPSETAGTIGTTVTISSTSTLKALAYKAGYSDTAVTSALYTIIQPQAAAPSFSPAAGTYATAQNVTISDATAGATIRYTTDGSTPSETAGTLYSGPVNLSKSTTLKAIAYKTGFSDSPVTTGAYTIAPLTLNFEAESLSYTGSGATTSVQTDKNSSGGKWVELAGNSVGDHIDFTVPNVPAGTYQLKMEWKGNNTRGILQLSVDGANLGPTLDQYSSGQTYPTTTFGNVTFSAAGNHDVRLTVTGKNSKSSSYQLSADKFTLVGQ